jgi:hypothetical protein
MRLRMTLKSELNAKNKIAAVAALAFTVWRYRCGIINSEETQRIDRETEGQENYQYVY